MPMTVSPRLGWVVRNGLWVFGTQNHVELRARSPPAPRLMAIPNMLESKDYR
jgi:hypothetical protein